MRYGKLAVILLLVGAGLVVLGLYVTTMDVGSCPVEAFGNPPGCYHVFAGTNIAIAPTGWEIVDAGWVALALGFAVLFLSLFLRKPNWITDGNGRQTQASSPGKASLNLRYLNTS